MNAHTPQERESVAKRLRALQALAQDAGATEAEAFAAAQKARELMDKYNMDLTEAEVRADPLMQEVRWSQGRYDDYAKVGIPFAVSKYCDVRIWINRNGALVILGQKQDVQFARWLLDTLMGYVARGAQAHQGTHTEKRNFAMSAAARICKRMMDEVEARSKVNSESKSHALVLVTKQALIDEELKRIGLRLRKGPQKDWAGSAEGYAHGDNARWDRPINNGSDVRRLK